MKTVRESWISMAADEVYRIPKWFWGIAGAFAIGLGHVGVVAYEASTQAEKNHQMIQVIDGFTKKWAELSTETREEQLRRSNWVQAIDDLKASVSAIRSSVDLMREDVIILKTQLRGRGPEKQGET